MSPNKGRGYATCWVELKSHGDCVVECSWVYSYRESGYCNVWELGNEVVLFSAPRSSTHSEKLKCSTVADEVQSTEGSFRRFLVVVCCLGTIQKSAGSPTAGHPDPPHQGVSQWPHVVLSGEDEHRREHPGLQPRGDCGSRRLSGGWWWGVLFGYHFIDKMMGRIPEKRSKKPGPGGQA